MHIKDQKSRIYSSSDRTKRNQDREREDKESTKLEVLNWLTSEGVKDVQKFWDLPIIINSSLRILQ